MSASRFGVFVSLALMSSGVLAAASTKRTPPPTPAAGEIASAPIDPDWMAQCSHFLADSSGGQKFEADQRYDNFDQKWTLGDFLDPDPERNLAIRYPTSLMSVEQHAVFTLNHYESRIVLDPAYRRKKFRYYPALSGGVPEARGLQVFGHLATISKFMDELTARSQGKAVRKAIGLTGPAGTGKTVLLNLAEIIGDELAKKNPLYQGLTYRFVNLQQIPALRVHSQSQIDDLTLHRSPVTLLTSSLQARLFEFAKPHFRKHLAHLPTGPFDPMPLRHPSNKARRAIDEIVKHYARLENKSSVSDADYLRYLSAHVEIVRRKPFRSSTSNILRYPGKYPDLGQLTFAEDLALSQQLGPSDPLVYRYGSIPQNDGRIIYADELPRWPPDVLNLLLELIENGVLAAGGATPEYLDTLVVFSGNPQSFNNMLLKAGGENRAILTRTIRLQMRSPIEPFIAAKIALSDSGRREGGRSAFYVRALGQNSEEPVAGEVGQSPSSGSALAEKLVPYDAQVVIPDADNGVMKWPDGRYAIYYWPDREQAPVLVSPGTLMFLGLTASATRIVTDVKKFEELQNGQNGDPKRASELHTFQQHSEYFVDPVRRLQVLSHMDSPPQVVATELDRVRELLGEGDEGIGARSIEIWFTRALNAAQGTRQALTPSLMKSVFEQILDEKGFEEIDNNAGERLRFQKLANDVIDNFILPKLRNDVLAILGGPDKVDLLYAEIKSELLALAENGDANQVYTSGDRPVPINKTRLNAIKKIYKDLHNGNELIATEFGSFHAAITVSSSVQKHPRLEAAIKYFLIDHEISAATFNTVLEQFSSSRELNPSAQARVNDILFYAEKFGYDRQSFEEAVRFVKEWHQKAAPVRN